MKESWEIKKLGEVCEIQGGSTPKRTESLYWDNGTYPWFTVEDIREQGRIITNTKQKITKKAWDKLRVFPEDTILLCCTASLGEYAITKIPLTSNQQFNGLTIKDKNYLSPMYLMHYCATLKNKLYALSGKATIDFVSAEKVKQISIPIPPLPEQERIVSELDLISGVIDKKKQQLKELDSLAQSVFYEMFGNPVENDKGWDVKKLGEVCDVRDGTHDSPKYLENSDYVLITSKNIVNGTIDFTSVSYISEEDFVNINKRSGVDDGDIIMAMIGTIGKPVIVKDINRNFCIKNVALIKFVNESLVTNTYIRALLDNVSYCQYIQSQNKGGTQKFVALGAIRKFDIPTPPLPLQQEFASKIEKIDKQKELIKQSLQETETLFNSRMDFYFN